MDQEIYDNLISVSLDTISSEYYLKLYGIYRSQILYDQKLQKFAKKLNKGEAKPGIYPIAPGVDLSNINFNTPKEKKDFIDNIGATVHYYSINPADVNTIANGYPAGCPFDAVFTKAVGLNAQEEGSHGFCQTFALIYYQGEKDILSKNKNDEERYRENIDIALKWLIKFTKKNDIVFNLTYIPREKVIFKKKTIDYLNSIKKIKTNKEVTLFHIFTILNYKKNDKFFSEWFSGEGDENDSESDSETLSGDENESSSSSSSQ